MVVTLRNRLAEYLHTRQPPYEGSTVRPVSFPLLPPLSRLRPGGNECFVNTVLLPSPSFLTWCAAAMAVLHAIGFLTDGIDEGISVHGRGVINACRGKELGCKLRKFLWDAFEDRPLVIPVGYGDPN